MQKVISVAIAVLAILIVFSNTGVATAKDYVFAKWEAWPDGCKKVTKPTQYYSGRFVIDKHNIHMSRLQNSDRFGAGKNTQASSDVRARQLVRF